MILVSFGLLIHKETVTKVDARIGNILKAEWNVLMPNPQLIRINIIGQRILSAHFLFLRFTKISSLNIQTPLGIMPAVPPIKQ